MLYDRSLFGFSSYLIRHLLFLFPTFGYTVSMKCIFCEIAKGRVPSFKVWESRSFMVLLDTKPINKGHLLLIPKKHFKDVFSMPEPWFTNLFKTAKKVAPILRRMSGAKRIGLAIEGFGVPHVHIHLVPVNKGNKLNPLRAKRVSVKELRKTQQRFIQRFRKLR